jgi:CHRD domain
MHEQGGLVMKHPGVLIALIVFIAGVSIVLSAQEQKGGKPLSAILTGGAEVPGPGDADGTGLVKLMFNPGQNQICYELTVENIATATAAHIHSGAADAAGPVVVMLKAPSQVSVKDCVQVEPDKISSIMKNPVGFYVNVHNAEFPNGAVRGQLGQ